MKIAKTRDAAEHRAMLAAREAWMDVQMRDNIRLRIDARTVEGMNRLVARWTLRFRLAYHGLGRIARRVAATSRRLKQRGEAA